MIPSHQLDFHRLTRIITRYEDQGRPGLLPILLETQAAYGFLSEPLVLAISQRLRVPAAEIHGVIEFYSMLYREPVGETIIRVCTGPRCVQLGSEQLLQALNETMDVLPGGTSLYRWQGKMQAEPEWVMILKTARGKDCAERVKALHPYEEPAILEWLVEEEGSSQGFLDWVRSETLG